jgi:hypothetical protein
MALRPARAVGCLAVALAVLLAAVTGVYLWLREPGAASPVPGQQRCVATASPGSVSLDLDQAHFASIIVGLSVRRGLPPRAASIAMATVYQETGIRNLDGGDRDSVGLFQQRPSQGWGTPKQLQDPYYATGKFYDALVKVDDWESDDINDVAQKVQRSGYPEAYRDHETDGRILASTLTGQTVRGFTCLERSGSDGDARALVTSLNKTFGSTGADRDGSVVTVEADSVKLAWAYASYAVANSEAFGLVTADVGGKRWSTATYDLPAWVDAEPKTSATTVTLTVR